MSETRPNKCSHCHAPTSIHVTKVVDGKAVKVGLCEKCPKALALKSGHVWDLIGSEDGGKQPSLTVGNERSCPGCGLKPSDFKEHGRLGCGRCYETFEEKLEPVIRKLHRGGCHVGKSPGGRKRVVSPEELAALRRQLDECVSREDYEMAAEVRDQINALEG